MRECGIWLTLWIATLVSVVQTTQAKQPPRAGIWYTDFQEAQAEARKRKLPLLIHFYADWCGPCKKMESEVLSSVELSRQVADHFIAVKVNSDHNEALVEKYDVESLPTDLFVEPGGRIISRTSGYQEKHAYLASVARVDARWVQTQKYQIAVRRRSSTNDSSRRDRRSRDSNHAQAEKEANHHSQIDSSENPKSLPDHNRNVRGESRIGLAGFSPVALTLKRKWVKGSRKYASRYKGITYYLASERELSRFSKQPEQFAPRLLGCDPVVLWKTDRAIAGSTEYGAFFNGELFLFVSRESRDQFKVYPRRYTRARHVLLPDQIEKQGLRRAAVDQPDGPH